MKLSKCFVFAGFVTAITLLSSPVLAEGKFHCEVTKDGKKTDIKDATNRKQCNEKGGKWVKEHGHDHGPGEAEHGPEEGDKKEEKEATK